jgi:hypothetical protein
MRSVGSGDPKPFGTQPDILDRLEQDKYNDRCRWGEMKMHTPPLTERLARKKGRQGMKHVDRGGALRNVNRVKMDGKPFRREVKGRKRSGAILLDLSGSMSVSNAQLEEAVKQCPQAVIAAYSGSGLSGWDNGDLIILARDGKAVPDARAAIRKAGMGGNNQVDLPALEWLVREARKQHGVPIWVSDGYATCPGYNGDPVTECAVYAFRHGVHRVSSFSQLLSEYRPQAQRR